MAQRMLMMLMIALLGGSPTLWAAQVQHRLVNGTVGETSHSLAYTSSVGANSLLVACCSVFYVSGFSSAAATFSDTLGNTWATAVHVGVNDAGSNPARLYLGYALSPSGGANTVTCNPPNTETFITLVIIEYSGMATSSVLDQTISNTGTATSVSSGTTGPTTQADEMLVGCMTYEAGANRTITETSPLVLVDEYETQLTSQSIGVGERVLTTPGTYSAAWTLSAGGVNGWAAAAATFNALVVPPSTRRGHAIIFP